MISERSRIYAKDSALKGLDFKSNPDLLRGIDIAQYERNGFVFSSYTITETDVGRPDLISLKLYGTIDYWWMLMRANGISDVFNDLFVGLKIKVVPVNMMDDFLTLSLKSIKGN